MLDRVFYLPLTPEPKNGKKGNGGKCGLPALGNLPKIDIVTGERLRHGNGCYLFPNCFKCPYPPNQCHYGDKPETRQRMLTRNKQLRLAL